MTSYLYTTETLTSSRGQRSTSPRISYLDHLGTHWKAWTHLESTAMRRGVGRGSRSTPSPIPPVSFLNVPAGRSELVGPSRLQVIAATTSPSLNGCAAHAIFATRRAVMPIHVSPSRSPSRLTTKYRAARCELGGQALQSGGPPRRPAARFAATRAARMRRYARDKDAGSSRSIATGATEDEVSRRLTQTRRPRVAAKRGARRRSSSCTSCRSRTGRVRCGRSW